MTSSGDEWVRASELAQYAYCARAWWLQRVKGFQPENVAALDQGLALHHAHGRSVAATSHWRRWAYGLLAIAALCVVLVLWQWVSGS
jgi:CRISPR/Cas system-associated exonuclease Cas4 (RecB family)